MRVSLLTLMVLFGIESLVYGQSPATPENRFAEIDANGDGIVTAAELPRPVIFRMLDRNGDGRITLAEARAALPREGNPVSGDTAGKGPENEGKVAADGERPNGIAAEKISANANETASRLRQGPELLKPGDHGVGLRLSDLEYVDIEARPGKLSDFGKGRTVVIAVTSTSCPISRKYLPTLVEMAKNSPSDTAWILVNPIATDSLEDIREAATRFEGKAIYLHDRDGRIARALGAGMTTDAFVVDSARTIRFHGAVDDQYGFGYSIDKPRKRYLADALKAVTQGLEPMVSATTAPGCVLDQPRTTETASTGSAKLTYHGRISRIIQRNCLVCHRDDGAGPFSLETYEDLVAHAAMIRRVVDKAIMPPWFAAESAGKRDDTEILRQHWVNDRSLGTVEKNDLLTWIDSGRIAGDPAEAPVPLRFPKEWQIGEPDVVYEFAEPVAIKATGVMPYQQVVVETGLDEDRWVKAIEIRPGAIQVVHHALVFVQRPDEDDATAARSADESDGFWGIYVPGNSALVYPEGFAKRLPKGSKLRFQMHYTPNGTETSDRTRIGLKFAESPPAHEVRVAGVVNTRLNIPPGEANHREIATLRVPAEVRIMGFLPHMHLRGKACRYELIRANGEMKTLLDIPRYDFNWQLLYRLTDPVTIAAGDEIRFSAWFDNSDGNPANPDPTKNVRWGPQTYDEMQLGYVEYYVPTDKPGESVTAFGRRPGARADGARIEAFFKRLDRDSDGKLSGDEIPDILRTNMGFIDADGDEAITLDEIRKARGNR